MYPWFGSVLILVFDEEIYVSISRPSFLIDFTSNLIKEDSKAAEDILYLQCQHKLPSTFRNFSFSSLTKPIGFQRFNSKNSVWIWSKFTHFPSSLRVWDCRPVLRISELGGLTVQIRSHPENIVENHIRILQIFHSPRKYLSYTS